MTQEQEKELMNALDKVYKSEEYCSLTNLVLGMKDSHISNPSVERMIDETFICRGAWLYDTLNGKPTRGKTLLQKIRKVLGYTNP